MNTKHAAALLMLSFVMSASHAKEARQVFAQCESDAYGVLGIQTDARASLDYLEKKSELVRVCMLRQGFVFKSIHPDSAWLDNSTNAYRRYGMTKTPMYQIPAETQRKIDEEIQRGRVMLTLNSANWN